MDGTADNSTPQMPEATGFPLPWDEALKRAQVKSEEEAGPFGALAELRDKLTK